jgi:uncharacterized protein YndB with AHSA1/START domain
VTRRTRAEDRRFVEAAPQRVFAVLVAVDRYALWWPPAYRPRVLSPPPHGVGSVVQATVAGSRLVCRIAAADEPRSLVVEYVAGPHRGRGEWVLMPEGSGTAVIYAFDAEPVGPVARLLSHVVDFAAIHSRHMKLVLDSLAWAAEQGAAEGGASIS